MDIMIKTCKSQYSFIYALINFMKNNNSKQEINTERNFSSQNSSNTDIIWNSGRSISNSSRGGIAVVKGFIKIYFISF